MSLQDSKFYNDHDPDYLAKSFCGEMVRYSPNGTAPLFAITALSNKSGIAKDVEHGYFAKTLVFPSVQINDAGGYNTTDTTFTVDSTENIVPGEMLLTASNEIVRVSAVTSATEIVVARKIGQVAAAALLDNEILYSIGNSHEQGSLRPQSRLMNPTRVMNNTQIFRNSWALPRTVIALTPIVGNTLGVESKQDCAFFHAADIEKAMIFGQKSGQIINGQYLTTMDGLVETVRRLAPTGNTSVASATTTYEQLEAMLNPVFDTIITGKGSSERILLVGGTARTVINNIGRLSGQYQIVDGQTSFGLQFQTFKTSRGSFKMLEHPIFTQNPMWRKMAIAVSPEVIRQMYLRPTLNEEYGSNGQLADNGQDAAGGVLTTELTIENLHPGAHAVIYNLTAAAKSA